MNTKESLTLAAVLSSLSVPSLAMAPSEKIVKSSTLDLTEVSVTKFPALNGSFTCSESKGGRSTGRDR